MKRIAALVMVIALLVWAGLSMVFTVDQREYAVVSGFGNFGSVKRVILAPGLYFKLPVPFEDVAYLDNRIQTIDYTKPDGYASADTPSLFVSLIIKWRTVDARQYFVRFAGNTALAQDEISQLLRSALSKQLAQRNLAELLSSNPQAMLKAVREQIAQQAKELGVEIVDVQIKRIDLPAEKTNAVYQKMEVEQKKNLAQLSANGTEQAQMIRTQAQLQREAILALAYKKAQSIKGEGDAQAATIEAEVSQKAPDFYHFFKSLEVYRRSSNGRDVMVVDPSSEFFRFMRRPAAIKAAAEKKH